MVLFWKRLHLRTVWYFKIKNDFDPMISSPACVGYSLQIYKPKNPEPEIVEKKIEIEKLSEREYIEQFVFPVLLPALELMLAKAKLHRCFEVNMLSNGLKWNDHSTKINERHVKIIISF